MGPPERGGGMPSPPPKKNSGWDRGTAPMQRCPHVYLDFATGRNGPVMLCIFLKLTIKVL